MGGPKIVSMCLMSFREVVLSGKRLHSELENDHFKFGKSTINGHFQ